MKKKPILRGEFFQVVRSTGDLAPGDIIYKSATTTLNISSLQQSLRLMFSPGRRKKYFIAVISKLQGEGEYNMPQTARRFTNVYSGYVKPISRKKFLFYKSVLTL